MRLSKGDQLLETFKQLQGKSQDEIASYMRINPLKDSKGEETVLLKITSEQPKFMKLKDERQIVKFKAMGSDNQELYICLK